MSNEEMNISASAAEPAPKHSKMQYALGVIALIMVVVGWVGTNFLTREILYHYDKPFFLTFLSGIFLQAYFLFNIFGDPLKARPANDERVDVESSTTSLLKSPEKEPLPPLTMKQTAFIGFFAYIFYFWSNYLTNSAFGLTSSGSASILASTCGFFTLVFGAIMRVERLTFMKAVAVVISIGGVIVLGKSDFAAQDNRMLGNLFALIGACMYGIYSVYLKKATVDESRVSTLTLFAFVGFFTMLLSWPFFIIFHWTCVETFVLPRDPKLIGYLVINAVFGSLIPNYLWNVAFSYTSQLVVAIGLSFTIPLTLLGEYVLDGTVCSWYKIASAGCIMVGFMIVNAVEVWPSLDINWRQVFCLKPKD